MDPKKTKIVLELPFESKLNGLRATCPRKFRRANKTCTEIHNDATLTFEKRRRVYSQFVNGKTLERPH